MFDKMTEKVVEVMKKKIVAELPVVPTILVAGCVVTVVVLLVRQSHMTVVNNHYIWCAG